MSSNYKITEIDVADLYEFCPELHLPLLIRAAAVLTRSTPLPEENLYKDLLVLYQHIE
jgi:hypothetical protein